MLFVACDHVVLKSRPPTVVTPARPHIFRRPLCQSSDYHLQPSTIEKKALLSLMLVNDAGYNDLNPLTPQAIIVPHQIIRTLAVDGWAVTFGTARRGLGGLRTRCTKCNSPPINDQCTNHCIDIRWSVALRFNAAIKGLIACVAGCMKAAYVSELHWTRAHSTCLVSFSFVVANPSLSSKKIIKSVNESRGAAWLCHFNRRHSVNISHCLIN